MRSLGRMHRILFACRLGLLFAALSGSLRAAETPPALVPARATADRWVYCPTNFQVNANVDRLLALFDRAQAAGYNGIILTDFKFGRMRDRPANYAANLARTRRAAAEHHLALIACVMPVGYAGEILQNDPNLAEGIPATAVPFTVHGDHASADTTELLPDGDAEKDGGKRIAGWDWCDGPGVQVARDTAQHHGGVASLRFSDFRTGNTAGNCRAVKTIAVAPYRQYHLSFWLRSAGVAPAGEVRVAVLGQGDVSLNYAHLGVRADQEWTQHHVVFTSEEQTSVRVYLGIWGGDRGSFWVDDVSLKACAGVNLLRREGCPVVVSDAAGTTTYREGSDYAPWSAPESGHQPWAGEFAVWHPEPPLRLLPGSRISDGQSLRVSYYHAVTVYDGQVALCLRHPDAFRYLRTEVEDLQRQLAPAGWLMNYDEIRCARRCALCASAPDAGPLLAEHLARATALLREVAPHTRILTWSDMFDPQHNAHGSYFHVAGSWAGSWLGLTPDVEIVNWNSGKAAESLRFFAERGQHQIIAGFYDDPAVAAGLAHWQSAAKGLPGITGLIYTTWDNDYSHLEEFARSAGFHP
jgi:hypothetical protein